MLIICQCVRFVKGCELRVLLLNQNNIYMYEVVQIVSQVVSGQSSWGGKGGTAGVCVYVRPKNHTKLSANPTFLGATPNFFETSHFFFYF